MRARRPVARSHRPTPELGAHLDALTDRFPMERSLAHDPLEMVRPFAADRRAAEIAGLCAATLAIGNTTAIRGAFRRLEERIGGDFPGWVDAATHDGGARRLAGFQHRWVRGDQLDYLAGRLRDSYERFGSLESVYLEGASEGGFRGGLDALALALRAPAGARAPRGYDRLFPSPVERSRSPCKRLTLYLRWMVRRDYPDLGLWTRVSPADLRIPLDQHVYWIAYHIGLTQRRTRSWATVEEVTEALRGFAPDDPTRYDFALCHTGISGDCPKRRDLSICGACAVRPDCRLWRGRGSAG